jgi:hypothetical protein
VIQTLSAAHIKGKKYNLPTIFFITHILTWCLRPLFNLKISIWGIPLYRDRYCPVGSHWVSGGLNIYINITGYPMVLLYQNCNCILKYKIYASYVNISPSILMFYYQFISTSTNLVYGLWCLMPLSTILACFIGVPGENHRPAATRWQTLSHN